MSAMHAKRVKHSKNHFIYKLFADEKHGLPAYYFLMVEPRKHKLFLKAIAIGNCDLAGYGKILLSGYGNPSEKDKKTIKEQYDIEEC